MNSDTRTVLVLAANGRLGRAAVDAFAADGWRVLAQMRRAPTMPLPAQARPLQLPMADIGALAEAARGASVVVYGANPLYTAWAEQMLPLARQGMDTAQALGAAFMLPGNVYNFGTAPPPLIRAGAPQEADTPKGRLRVALEREMQARAGQGLRSVVIRAGDFYGGGSGSWFDQAIVKDLRRGRLVYPGPSDRIHAWAYLPDLAAVFAAVAASGIGPGCTDLPFAGHALTGAALLQAIETAADTLGLRPAGGFRHAGLPWWLLRLAGVAVPLWRDLAEMSYLWRVPHALDDAALRAHIGEVPHTPLEHALQASLRRLFPAAAVQGGAVRA
jgi:nucleoside-diphosphate-sugar epimerase